MKNTKFENNSNSTQPSEQLNGVETDSVEVPTEDKRADKNSTKSKKKKRALKIAAITATVLIVTPFAVLGIAVAGFQIWASTVSFDKSLLPTASALPVFYDKNGVKLDYAADNYVAPDDISENLKKAFVSLEDKRFYKHHGYDPVRIAGAVVSDIKSGRLKEGASTITQQLVKNTHLTQERTVKRKLNEIAIAEKIEKAYSKDEILSMYLSVIYFGGGAYGINAASKMYFGKTPSELTLAECATLAGIVKNPSKYSPKFHIDNAFERRNLVLDIMAENNAITATERDEAKAEELKLNPVKTERGINKYYIDRAIAEVTSALNITKYQLNNSGYKIYTNLDSTLQRTLAEQAEESGNFSKGKIDNEALVLDNITGAVIANYSSLPFRISRQPGSALKPVAVYAPALEEGLISLATPIVDEKISFGGYSPENFGGKYYGETTPREAVKKSMNSVAVKIIDSLGAEKSADYVKKFGINISDSDKNYALALGATSKGVRTSELAAAYSVFAKYGCKSVPHYIKYVVKDENKIIDNTAVTYNIDRVISEETAFLTTSALLDTVKNGTAKGLSFLPFEVAAKTGTVAKKNGKNSDAWNVGYTTAHTVLVWHGADNTTEQGGGAPTRHAANIWRALYEGTEKPLPFTTPSGVSSAEIDTYSTSFNKRVTLASPQTPAEYRKREYFATSKMPSDAESKFKAVQVPDFKIYINNGVVEIEFKPLGIYNYRFEKNYGGSRTNIGEYAKNGGKSSGIFAAAHKQSDGTIRIYDKSLSFGGRVDYTLRAGLGRGSTATASFAESTQTIFLPPLHF